MEAPIRDRSYNEKLNYFLLPVLLVAIDLLVVCGTMFLAMLLTEFVLGEELKIPRSFYVLLPILYMSNLLLADLYRTRRVMTDYARKIFKASLFSVVTIILFDFVLHGGELPLSRVFLLLFYIPKEKYLCFKFTKDNL